jgi:hypothetical protein
LRLTQANIKKLLSHNKEKIFHTENFLTNGFIAFKKENFPFKPDTENIKQILPAKASVPIENAPSNIEDTLITWFKKIDNPTLQLYKSNIYYSYKHYEACIFFSDGFTNFAILNKLYVDVLRINIILYLIDDFKHNTFLTGPFLTEHGEELVMGMDRPENDPFLRKILHAVMEETC